MLKLDGCYASAEIYETGYPNMTKALNATGRPIVFSCSWPAYIKNVSVHTKDHRIVLTVAISDKLKSLEKEGRVGGMRKGGGVGERRIRERGGRDGEREKRREEEGWGLADYGKGRHEHKYNSLA